MAANCLASLVAALDAQPACDLAHCNLRVIDDSGRPTADWWSYTSAFARSSGDYLNRPHTRRAPFDAWLHLLGHSVYISTTQLLIRRTLFDRVGLFESRWGSVGDFNWNMRAAMVANTVHVPDTWGGWRVHPGQATAAAAIGSAEHAERIQSMIEDALTRSGHALAPPLQKPLAQSCELGEFLRSLESRPSSLSRKGFVLRRLIAGSATARAYLKAESGLFGGPRLPDAAPDLIRSWLESAGMGTVLVDAPIRAHASPRSSA
jgi:hypothetical protein